MHSELKPAEYTDEFTSGGPKNYAYRVITNEGEKTVCKVRCITLNYHASKLVNFEVIRAMMLEQGEPIVNVHTEHKIKRKRRAGGTVAIVAEPENKRYRISFKKRRMHDHSSVPFGYIYRGEVPGREPFTARPSMGDYLRFKHPFSLVSGPSGSCKSSFCIRFCKTSKHYVPSIPLAVESSGAIVGLARFPLGSWPGRNTFVFTKECQQTLTTVGKNHAS